MTRVLRAALVLAFMFVVSSRAHAASSYVCEVTYWPPDVSELGAYGHVSVLFTSGPSCTGAPLSTGIYCSTGATFSGCDFESYSEAALLAVFQSLQRAAATNQPTSFADGRSAFFAAGF